LPSSQLRVSPRRLALSLALGALLLAGTAVIQPYPRYQEGAVLCLPIVGPRMRLPLGLPDTTEARVRAHEAAHMLQCQRQGSVRMLLAQWSPTQRLRLEAEAGCAEAQFSWRGGRRADHAFEDLVDFLTYGMPRGFEPTPEAARTAATLACADLHAAAQEASRGP
jgi:hypothetical protein